MIVLPMTIGILVGLAGRFALMRAGWHEYPTEPHGRIIHGFLGAVAAVLGSLGVASLLTANVTAAVFLAIGGAQFHAVRDLERKLLIQVDKGATIKRGPLYIEGIATAFEARNFLIVLSSAVACLGAAKVGPLYGAVLGLLTVWLTLPLAKGKVIGDIADVTPLDVQAADGETRAGGTLLWTFRGAPPTAALALSLQARDIEAWATLQVPGQRQALMHDLTLGVGLAGDGNGAWPVVRVDHAGRRLIVATVPDRDVELQAVAGFARQMPVLELALRRPALALVRR